MELTNKHDAGRRPQFPGLILSFICFSALTLYAFAQGPGGTGILRCDVRGHDTNVQQSGSFIRSLKNNLSAHEYEKVLERYRQFLIKNSEPLRGVDSLLALYNGQGQWRDIDYQDQERADWQLWPHLIRIRDLALEWNNPASKHFHQEELRQVIHGGLDHWLQNRYKNPNWWHNEIGIPQTMRDLIVLMREDLSPAQLKGALEVMAQLRVQEKATGANLTWSADLGLHYGALTGDTVLMNKCRHLLLKEIRITTDEGIQPDYSFHQHGARLQTYHYGGAFLRENIRLAWECYGTPWAFPGEKISILSDFVLKGWQWMARGIHTAPGTIDRAVSRAGGLQSADLTKLLPYLCETAPERKEELTALEARQKGTGKPLKGFRYFPYSDFSAYQQASFSFFLKTISTRTLYSESINSENLKGRLLNSGDGYLIRNGNEYFDLMPVWDWNLLPQVTAFKGAEQAVRSDFAGSVSDGTSGMTAMDYGMKGSGNELLRIKKIWACHDGMVVCLISGPESTIPGGFYTTLDQCRLQGKVTVNEPGNILTEGVHEEKQVKWIYHAGRAYILLNPSPVKIRMETNSGSWNSISLSASKKILTEKVFCPVLLHGAERTAYMLTAARTPEEAAAIARKPGCEMLRNDSICQAVRFRDGTLMAAFFRAGSVQLERKELTADKPCLILISGKQIHASNPLWKKETLQITCGRKSFSIALPANGLTSEGLPL
jgi:chondroitin AC lyase